MPTTSEQPVYGPVEPRSMEVLQAEQAAAAEITDAIQQERAEIASLPTGEQAKQAGHIALLESDEQEAMQMQSDTLAEAQVRNDIDRNRRQARLAEIRANRAARQEQDKVDPMVPDPQTGQPIRQSELAAVNSTQGKTDSGTRY